MTNANISYIHSFLLREAFYLSSVTRYGQVCGSPGVALFASIRSTSGLGKRCSGLNHIIVSFKAWVSCFGPMSLIPEQLFTIG